MSSGTVSPRQQFARTAKERVDAAVQAGSEIDLTAIFPADQPIPNDLGERLRYIQAHNSDYLWPFIRQVLHQLLLSRMPHDQIGKRFNVTARTIDNWARRLREEMRAEAVAMRPRDLIADSLESLKEARAAAWRDYFAAKTPQEKSANLSLVTKIDGELMKLGQVVGLFDDQPLAPGHYQGETPREDAIGVPLLNVMAEDFLNSRPPVRGINTNSGPPKGFMPLVNQKPRKPRKVSLSKGDVIVDEPEDEVDPYAPDPIEDAVIVEDTPLQPVAKITARSRVRKP